MNMECPKCGLVQPQSSECSGCGIIIAKYLARQSAPIQSHSGARGKKTRYRFLEIDKELRNYYHSQSKMLGAGLSIAEANKSFLTNTKNLRDATPYQKIERAIRDGRPISTGMMKSDNYFPAHHARLIEAGEKSGSPERMFAELHDFVEQKLTTYAMITTALRRPVFTLIASVFLVPVPILVSNGLLAYLDNSLVPLLFLAAMVYLLHLLFQYLNKSEKVSLAIDRKLLEFPLYETFETNQFVRVYHALYCAGVDNASAFSMSTSVLGNSFLVKVLSSSQPFAERGNSLSSIIRETGVFSPELSQFITTGEASGTLDASLKKYLESSDDSFRNRLSRFSTTLSTVIGITIMLYVGVQILQGYSKLLPG